jgi:hypothetical protein
MYGTQFYLVFLTTLLSHQTTKAQKKASHLLLIAFIYSEIRMDLRHKTWKNFSGMSNE